MNNQWHCPVHGPYMRQGTSASCPNCETNLQSPPLRAEGSPDSLRERVARQMYKEFCGGSWDAEPPWFKTQFFERVDHILSLLPAEGPRSASGADKESLHDTPIMQRKTPNPLPEGTGEALGEPVDLETIENWFAGPARDRRVSKVFAQRMMAEIHNLRQFRRPEVQGKAADILALLKRIEWNGEFGDCPECGEGGTPETHQHKEGCDLAKAIHSIEGEVRAWYCTSCDAFKPAHLENGDMYCACGMIIASYREQKEKP